MDYHIECSDEYGFEGIPDGSRLAEWIENWLRDPDSDRCVIEKTMTGCAFDPTTYSLQHSTDTDS